MLGGIFVNFVIYLDSASNFKGMLKLIKEHFRRKALKEAIVERSAKQGSHQVFLNFNEISSVGFLYALESEEDFDTLNQITEEFGRCGIPFKGLVIEGAKLFKDDTQREEFAQECLDEGLTFIPNTYLNWVGVMAWQESEDAGAEIDEFFSNHFDLFISLNQKQNFTADYLTMRVDADFIAGMHNNPQLPYSLVLEYKEEDFSYSQYITSLFNFLKQVNNK